MKKITRNQIIANRINRIMHKPLQSKDYGRLGKIVKTYESNVLLTVLEYFESNPEVRVTLGLFQFLLKKEKEKDFFDYETIHETIERNKITVDKLLGELI